MPVFSVEPARQPARSGLCWPEQLLVCLTRNDYEPGICFFGKEKARSFKPNQTKFPASDFVVEILSQSTEAVDRGVKFEDYALNQVGEYWIADPEWSFCEPLGTISPHFEGGRVSTCCFRYVPRCSTMTGEMPPVGGIRAWPSLMLSRLGGVEARRD